MLLQLEVKV